jgi:hypothetical protein
MAREGKGGGVTTAHSMRTHALAARFDERVVRGRVVTASTPQLVEAPFDWLALAARIGLATLGLLVFVGMLRSLEAPFVILMVILWWVLYKLLPSLVRFLWGKVWRTTSRVPGWIFRKRRSLITSIVVSIEDRRGRQQHVRIDGEMRSGHISIGDDVSVAAANRMGVLRFRRGFNHRSGVPIRVARWPWQLR